MTRRIFLCPGIQRVRDFRACRNWPGDLDWSFPTPCQTRLQSPPTRQLSSTLLKADRNTDSKLHVSMLAEMASNMDLSPKQRPKSVNTAEGIKKIMGEFAHELTSSDSPESATPKKDMKSQNKQSLHGGVLKMRKNSTKTEESVPLDPRASSVGLGTTYSDPAGDLERLLNFMSDDNVLPPHAKPSTRDRIKASGERVWREDFEVERLLPYTRQQYTFSPDLGQDSRTQSPLERIEEADIEELDKALKAARSARIRSENEHFRQQNAFSYSSAVYHSANPRTMDRRNFFTPVYVDAFWSPRFSKYHHQHQPQTDMAKEYVILTPSQKIIPTNRMPFNNNHDSDGRFSQDVFTILSQLADPEKYIRTITRLEKQGWSIIGGGGPGNLVVFEREYDKKKRATRYLVQLACGLVVSVAALVGLLLAISEVPVFKPQPATPKDSKDS